MKALLSNFYERLEGKKRKLTDFKKHEGKIKEKLTDLESTKENPRVRFDQITKLQWPYLPFGLSQMTKRKTGTTERKPIESIESIEAGVASCLF